MTDPKNQPSPVEPEAQQLPEAEPEFFAVGEPAPKSGVAEVEGQGRVRVETVQGDMCTAVILKTYEGRTIEQGDNAATHI